MSEDKKKRNGKVWVITFLALIGAGMIIYMGLCYYANPCGYYTNVRDLPYYFKDDYARAIKARYVADHSDEIDGIILGGSKCGAVDVDLMKEYTGLNYYNMYLNLGNFRDYLLFTQFFAEKTQVKEIMLVLSSYEVLCYDRRYRGNNYDTPAIVEGTRMDRGIEFFNWMLVDFKTLKNSLAQKKKNPAYADSIVDGRRSRMRDIRSFNADPDAFAKRITSNYDKHLAQLFSGDIEDFSNVMAQNLEALRQMKQICEENGITLKVVFGPSTMTERYRYENERFYQYMEDVVLIAGEVWDFSDYNDINMNLYNYADALHYDVEVADLMVNTIYGKDHYEGFGQILTSQNVGQALEERRASFERCAEEFERTGTVRLGSMEDESYLPWRETWVSSAAALPLMREYWEKVSTVDDDAEMETDSDDQ